MPSPPSVNEASPLPGWGASTTVDEPATAVSTPATPIAEETLPALASMVSRYVVLEEVGRGGMGRVLRAYDPKLEREVALKELHHTALDEDAAKRLKLEARAMAKLSHPHVVAIYDVEELGAQVVLVMELVRGVTLRRWLAATERSWSEVVAMLVQAGRGLAAAHEAGLLHRDFKPGNVLVSEDGTAKVMDFGLAKLAGDRSSSWSGTGQEPSVEVSTELTAAGTVLGTPRYMAPEQHFAETLTPATDQYAFCVTLWEALCGAPPFAGATMKDVAARKLEPLPAWPKAGVPRPIVEAIVRGLSTKPEDRWPSMEALLAALVWDPSRARSRVRLGLGAAVVSSAVLVSYYAWTERRAQQCSGAEQQLAGVWDDVARARVQSAFAAVDRRYAEQAWRRTEAALDDYAHAWVAMHTDACEATTVRGEQSPQLLDLRMACLHRAAVELRSTMEVLADADAAVVQKAHELTGDLQPLSRCADPEALAAEVEPPEPAEVEAVEDARARLAEARSRLTAGRYPEAKAAVAAARTRLEGVEYGPVRTEVALVEGSVLERLGDYAGSEAALEDALRRAGRSRQWASMRRAATRLLVVVGSRQNRIAEGLRYRALVEGLSEGHPEDEAEYRNDLGQVLKAQGKYAEAEVEHRAALSAREAVHGPAHLAVARARSSLANVLSAQGKHAEAEAEHRAVKASMEAALGPEHPDVAMARNNIGTVLSAQGKYAAAEAELRAAQASWEVSLGAEHPNVAMARNNLANVLYAQGKYAEAEVELRAAQATWAAALGPEHPDVAASRANLANVLNAHGKHAEAEVETRGALASMEAALGPDHPDAARLRANLGSMLYAQGKHAAAEVEFRAVLASMEASLGAEHPDVGAARSNLANVLSVQGKHAEAEAGMRAALASMEAALGAEHPNVANLRSNLATVLFDQGKHAEAEVEHRTALASRLASLGADHPDVAQSRSLLAETLLALERPGEALLLAEQAWARRQRDDISPEPRAATAFVLAQVQWQVATGAKDRVRARSLAEDALQTYRTAGEDHRDDVDDVRAWLAAHPGD